MSLKQIRVMLEYFHPWTNSAGFYLARENGWYREFGLDVEFALQDPIRGDTLSYLSRDEVEFGIFPSNRLFVRRESGEDVIAIASINHRGLETISTIKSTQIRRPADLAGKRISLNPTARGQALVRYLVERDGGDPTAVQFFDCGTRELELEDIAQGVVDATFGSYWAWEALKKSQIPSEERVIWPVDQIGAPAYHGYLLGTNERQIARDPSTVQAFLAATERGYLAAARDPQSALPIYERVIPYFSQTQVSRSLDLIATTWLYQEQWGELREELLAPYAKWLTNVGILRKADIWKSSVTSEFLPARSLQ